MALSLESEQRLQRVDLIELFEKSPKAWKRLARQSYDFVKSNFPQGAVIRRDDVAKTLVPLLEVNDKLITFLSSQKLKQKYWITDFSDLIIDRAWSDFSP